jgi:hypothetical protein
MVGKMPWKSRVQIWFRGWHFAHPTGLAHQALLDELTTYQFWNYNNNFLDNILKK